MDLAYVNWDLEGVNKGTTSSRTRCLGGWTHLIGVDRRYGKGILSKDVDVVLRREPCSMFLLKF